MRGKNKCKILKEIRQKIADENDIPYVTRECSYQGDCTGTCPKCESELRYLERELEKRASLGKRVAVGAVCAGMALTTAGCSGPFTAIKENLDIGGREDISGGLQEFTEEAEGYFDDSPIDEEPGSEAEPSEEYDPDDGVEEKKKDENKTGGNGLNWCGDNKDEAGSDEDCTEELEGEEAGQ